MVRDLDADDRIRGDCPGEAGEVDVSLSGHAAARRDGVLARLGERLPGRVAADGADPSGVDLVANATPLGMREGDPFPVDVAKLPAGQFVADVVTKPDPSPLIAEARRIGCATMPGAGMFDAQAQLLVDRMLTMEAV